MLSCLIVDDEELARRLLREYLARHADIDIVGECDNGLQAVEDINRLNPDLILLDIQMPKLNGLEVLAETGRRSGVIFTTAYDEYALRAFEVNSIDYLVKPIETAQLARALKKLDRLRPVSKSDWQQSPDLPKLLQELAQSLRGQRPDYPRRIASRVGERISFLDLESVTHFVAHDKLTYAIVNGHRHVVDQTIVELERRLDPANFLRIHRAALVNIDWIQEVNSWFAGKVILSLKDPQRTQIPVARDRVRALKSRLGI